jgi:two-component system response regulator
MTTLRVLVADDNEDHLFLTVRALQEVPDVQLDIETATDGEEALDAVFGERPPNLILLDIKMPKLNGLEVLERLKADDRLRKIPVVVLTSSERPEDVDATNRLGGNSYVTKPSTGAGLREGLRRVSSYWTALATLPEPA